MSFSKVEKPIISYFRVFGYRCFILRNAIDWLGKFDERIDEGIFMGYSTMSKAFRVHNKRSHTVEESINVKLDENPPTHEDSNQVEQPFDTIQVQEEVKESMLDEQP